MDFRDSGCSTASTMGAVVQNLPIELVTLIMEHLSSADRISASQTCHLWYEASKNRKLHNHETVFISDNISRALKYLVPTGPTSETPQFFNFTFRDVEVKSTGEMRNFWPKFGPGMKNLSFQGCEISEKSLSDILVLCPKLESLHISGCSELFMSGKVLESLVTHYRMPLLKEIGLMHTRYMSDAIFNRFVTLAPNLCNIIVDGCVISCNDAVYTRFYPEQKRQRLGEEFSSGRIPLDVASNVLTLQNILSVLEARNNSITNLGFGHTSLNHQGLHRLLASTKNLKKICLASCFQLSKGIEHLVDTHNASLEFLDLSRCSFVSSDSFGYLPSLTSLTTLNLNGCTKLTDETVKMFWNLKKLQSLNISSIGHLTGPAILEGLGGLRQLQHAYLSQLPLLESASLLQLLEQLPPLESLELEHCQMPALDTALGVLSRRHTTLKHLSLAHCPLVTDLGLTGISTLPLSIASTNFALRDKSQEKGISLASKAEQEIVFESKSNLAIEKHLAPYREKLGQETSTGVQAEGGIQNLQGLKSLNLSDCPRVTDLSIQHAFKFNELQWLSLQKNKNVSDVGVAALTRQCRGLREVQLQECCNLTDESVCHLSTLPRLRNLTLSGCEQLTNTSLESLMKGKSPLREVQIQSCPRFTRDAVNIFSNWLNHAITWSEQSDASSLHLPPDPPGLPQL